MLPKELFKRLAEVWTLCLEQSRLLEIWKQIRVVGIPKSDGGTRPLSVAAVAWRAGMTIIVRKLADWFDGWAPEEIIGGLRHRQAAEIPLQTHRSHDGDSVLGTNGCPCTGGEDTEGFLPVTTEMGSSVKERCTRSR